jgi:hypothetical protein
MHMSPLKVIDQTVATPARGWLQKMIEAWGRYPGWADHSDLPVEMDETIDTAIARSQF